MRIENWTSFNDNYQSIGESIDVNHIKKFLNEYTLNIHTYYAVKNNKDIFPNKNIEYKIDSIPIRTGYHLFNIYVEGTGENKGIGIFINIFIVGNYNRINIDLGSKDDIMRKREGRGVNMFSDKESLDNFILILKRLYIMSDPNIILKALSKFNNTEITKISHNDLNDGDNLDNFWKFLNENGYDWDRFINNVNTNSIYKNNI